MNIHFPLKSAYDFDAGSISFPAEVDGAPRRCLVSEEALQDHFGADGIDDRLLTEYFEANRGAIETVAADKIRNGAVGDVVLGTKDF